MFPPSSTISLAAALRDAIGARDPRDRAGAAAALGEVEGGAERDQAIATLIRALGDAHPDVRAAAALSLGALGDASATEALLGGLADGTALTRQASAIALGKLAAASAFEPLCAALRSGPPDLRFQAATSLCEIDPARAYDHLVTALDDQDGEVLSAIALGLATIGDPRAAGHLVRLLGHDRPQTRFDAAYALAELGDARGAEVLASFVHDRNVGWPAIEALERIGSAHALATLAQLLPWRLLRPPHLRVRAAAAVLALDAGGDAAPRARQVLIGALRSRRLDVRGLAVDRLGAVGGAWAIGPLDALARSRRGRPLRDEIADALVRVRAAGADQSAARSCGTSSA
jgi:HEAT repeat protein